MYDNATRISVTATPFLLTERFSYARDTYSLSEKACRIFSEKTETVNGVIDEDSYFAVVATFGKFGRLNKTRFFEENVSFSMESSDETARVVVFENSSNLMPLYDALRIKRVK